MSVRFASSRWRTEGIRSPRGYEEATARIKINKLLEAAGWRFFPVYGKPATSGWNIRLLLVQITSFLWRELREDPRGFIDFLLLNEKGFPLIVLEAKAEDRTRFRPRSRPANTPAHKTAASSFSPTAIFTILGLGARTPLHHYLIPHVHVGSGLPARRTKPDSPYRRASKRRLHRSHPAPRLPSRGCMAE